MNLSEQCAMRKALRPTDSFKRWENVLEERAEIEEAHERAGRLKKLTTDLIESIVRDANARSELRRIDKR